MSDAGVDSLWIELKPPYLFALVVHNIVLHIPKAVLLNHHTYIHRYKLFWLGTAQKRLLGGQEGGRDLCWPKWHYYPGAFHQIFEGGGVHIFYISTVGGALLLTYRIQPHMEYSPTANNYPLITTHT